MSWVTFNFQVVAFGGDHFFQNLFPPLFPPLELICPSREMKWRTEFKKMSTLSASHHVGEDPCVGGGGSTSMGKMDGTPLATAFTTADQTEGTK